MLCKKDRFSGDRSHEFVGLTSLTAKIIEYSKAAKIIEYSKAACFNLPEWLLGRLETSVSTMSFCSCPHPFCCIFQNSWLAAMALSMAHRQLETSFLTPYTSKACGVKEDRSQDPAIIDHALSAVFFESKLFRGGSAGQKLW
jgi:hypothetical protein